MLKYVIHFHTEFNCRAVDNERGLGRVILTHGEKEIVDAVFPLDAILYVSRYNDTVAIVLKDKSKMLFNYRPEDSPTLNELLFELRKAIVLNSNIAITINAEKI